MPGATGGDLLSRALSGGAAHSELGYRGPSAKRHEHGSIEDMAASLYGRDEKNLFAGRWDEIEEANEQAQSRKPKTQIKDDPYKVVVANALKPLFGKRAGKYFFLHEFLPNLNREETAYTFGGSDQLMPKGMTQDGRMEHPDHFLHSGFDDVKGTNVGSMEGAVSTYDRGAPPTENRAAYENEKELRRAMANINSTKKKVASLLVKVGLAAPPAIAGEGYSDEFPNGPNDIHGTDLERVSRADMVQPRLNRPSNLGAPNKSTSKSMKPSKTAAVASAASAGVGGGNGSSSGGDSFTLETKPSKEQKNVKMDPGKLVRGKPRRSFGDALKVRPYTEGVQYDKIPRGFPEFDPMFPQAKVASLLKKVGF